MNVVLLEPEIPANTGNIGRTCVSTGTKLHLIRPLGFSLAEKELKRAGLDYWPKLDVAVYEDWNDFRSRNAGAAVWMATTKARQVYTEVRYGPDDFLLFGKESAGLPEELLAARPERCVRIPMLEGERSLNLSNAAAVALFEALRHIDYKGLEKYGELHRLTWQETE